MTGTLIITSLVMAVLMTVYALRDIKGTPGTQQSFQVAEVKAQRLPGIWTAGFWVAAVIALAWKLL